jgi:hypothetical protein
LFRELEYIFFCHAKHNFFFQNSTLGYMTKTLNEIIFFFLHQNQYIFFSNTGDQNIFFRKHNPPPFKLNGRSLIGNIVNIVQHSHLYNSFLLIIVACIVILLVAILYRDHVGFCVIITFSSIHMKWPVLLSYIVLTGMKPSWDRIDARLAHQMFSWNFDVILSLYIGLCRCVLDTCI